LLPKITITGSGAPNIDEVARTLAVVAIADTVVGLSSVLVNSKLQKYCAPSLFFLPFLHMAAYYNDYPLSPSKTYVSICWASCHYEIHYLEFLQPPPVVLGMLSCFHTMHNF
jgi:hypothetical protein